MSLGEEGFNPGVDVVPDANMMKLSKKSAMGDSAKCLYDEVSLAAVV